MDGDPERSSWQGLLVLAGTALLGVSFVGSRVFSGPYHGGTAAMVGAILLGLPLLIFSPFVF